MCVLSLIQSLFIPVSVSLLLSSCVSLSLTISLPSLAFLCPQVPSGTVYMKEARFWEPDLWVTWSKKRSFVSRNYSQAQDPQHLHFSPAHSVLGPGKGK